MLINLRSWKALALRVALCIPAIFGASLFANIADAAPKYSILHTFTSEQIGGQPDGVPVYDSDGNLYGENSEGGGFGGTIYKVNRQGGISVLHAFGDRLGNFTLPVQPIIVDSGEIYGTEAKPFFSQGQSVLWKMTTGGNNYQVLYNFTAEVGPVTLGNDGYLYGTTSSDGAGYGTIYRIKADGTESSITVLHSFTSTEPYDSQFDFYRLQLIVVGSTLYGAGDQGIYSLATDETGKFKYRFFPQSVGSNPSALVNGQDGFLYGTTQGGGDNNAGAIFRYDPQTNRVKPIYSFRNGRDGEYGQSLFLGADGYLYGTTAAGGLDQTGQLAQGTAFRLGTDGKNLRILHTFPASGLEGQGYSQIGSTPDGQIIGYSTNGGLGRSFEGLDFKLCTSKTGKYHFDDFLDFNNYQALDLELGAYPSNGKLIFGKDNQLCGTTSNDVYSGLGLVYSITSDGSVYNGYAPSAEFGSPNRGLTFIPDGKYLTSTKTGGAYQKGAVYEISTDGTYTDVNDFAGANGSAPDSELTLATDGNYYGTTTSGGDNGQGCIYRLSYPSFTETVVYSFKGKEDGGNPNGALLQGSDGALYGVCYQGSNNENGTIWKITLDGQFSKIHQFTGADGVGPTSGLIEGFNGKLYGTTQFGGSHKVGVVFSVSEDGSSYQILHQFTAGKDGSYPTSSLTQASNGLLIGTSSGAQSLYTVSRGALFTINPDGSGFKVWHTFEPNIYPNDFTDGEEPETVIEGPDGDLYGTTALGGQYIREAEDFATGTVYKLATKLPIINSFTPSIGSAGTTVTITGANLANANAISFGGVPGVTVSHTGKQIVATVPANAVTGRIVVTVGSGQCCSLTNFAVN